MNKKYNLPNNLIILISGVPGVGKTTISHELLKTHKEFRLIEETDVIREILRGYNKYLSSTFNFDPQNIYSHETFLSYEMAKHQCNIMKHSILNIIMRQQRKNIPSIINGVHIIPEELYAETIFSNIVYINLYVDSEQILWKRLQNRDSNKYKYEHIPLIYQTNVDLNNSLHRIPSHLCKTYSINVSALSIQETILKIDNILYNLYVRLK